MRSRDTRLEAFLSLAWYEVALRFLFTFVAKTSEVLLAAGLVVSTASFLTDGSILAAHPDVSIAWAWAQALAIDSSLGVSLSYAFQYLKQEEWIRGALYGLLTLLLAGVAGGITTIDIVSHALHLSMNGAMAQMGINIAVLSRLRAIAVIGFILMGRLRDLPMTTLLTKTEPDLPPPITAARGTHQAGHVQAAIQALCSQFSTEEMAQVLNGCIAAKKLVLAQIAPKGDPGHDQAHTDRLDQSQSSESRGDGALQRELDLRADPQMQPGVLEPASSMELSEKTPGATRLQATMEHHLWKAPEPVAEVSSKEMALGQETAQEPQGEFSVPSEFDGVPSQDRLEQAYQSLVAEGKKPSGRALAERAHVHRSTCVEWLRMKQLQAPENEPLPGRTEPNGVSALDTSPDGMASPSPGKALERAIGSLPTEPSDTAMAELPEMEPKQSGVEGNRSSGVFPDVSLPEDTPDA